MKRSQKSNNSSQHPQQKDFKKRIDLPGIYFPYSCSTQLMTLSQQLHKPSVVVLPDTSSQWLLELASQHFDNVIISSDGKTGIIIRSSISHIQAGQQVEIF